MPAIRPSWPDRIHRLPRDHDVRQLAHVPGSGHARLIKLVRAGRQMHAIPLTTEEEGVVLAVGVWLGSGRSVLPMQSGGQATASTCQA